MDGATKTSKSSKRTSGARGSRNTGKPFAATLKKSQTSKGALKEKWQQPTFVCPVKPGQVWIQAGLIRRVISIISDVVIFSDGSNSNKAEPMEAFMRWAEKSQLMVEK